MAWTALLPPVAASSVTVVRGVLHRASIRAGGALLIQPFGDLLKSGVESQLEEYLHRRLRRGRWKFISQEELFDGLAEGRILLGRTEIDMEDSAFGVEFQGEERDTDQVLVVAEGFSIGGFEAIESALEVIGEGPGRGRCRSGAF